ncbi:hypothetical protein TNCV_140501 [Trichonephila clavipes]|uniref:Uncharacterized protein n=1 Tax=Trichonephila clavipes TaxID=2585209 RepID=A0A8X6UUH0_TRICX|nr:hypothetical protein TNCV_140501 [Trichonephila clavipes]
MEEKHHLARERIGLASEKMKTRYDARATGHVYHEGGKDLGSIPGEDMNIFKCIRPLRHDGTLYSRRATSPLSLVYADKPQTRGHLEDNIRRVIADIRPQMLEKVIENWTSRLD